MAARELGRLSLDDALDLCGLLADRDPPRFERAAVCWLERFIADLRPPLEDIGLAVLRELRNGNGAASVGTGGDEAVRRRRGQDELRRHPDGRLSG